MIFNEFLAKQDKIYAEFRDTSKLEAEGLIPQIFDNKGGYIIVLRHSDNIITNVENFAESNIHTTLATYQLVDGFSPVKKNLEYLANIVYHKLSLIKKIEIEYSEWLINQDSGIARGIPNLAFFENVRIITDYAHECGIHLKSPWGAHITVSRFLEKISHDQTLELLNIFENSKPLGISRPKYIDVGYFMLTPKSLKINVSERFEV